MPRRNEPGTIEDIDGPWVVRPESGKDDSPEEPPRDDAPPTPREYSQAAVLAMLGHAGDPEALRAIYRHTRDVLKSGEIPESLQEGTVTGVDSLGRPYKTVDGKRVPVGQDSAEGRAILRQHGKGGGTSSPPPGNKGAKGRTPSEEPQAPTPAQRAAQTKKNRAIGKRVVLSVANEKRLAQALTEATGVEHQQLPDNEAVDVQTDVADDVQHILELKSFWTNQTGQTHVSQFQRERKDAYARGELLIPKNTAVRKGIDKRAKSYGTDEGRRKYVTVPDETYREGVERRKHFVVVDHREIYAKAKSGKADLEDRGFAGTLSYQRGFRAWNVAEMVQVETPEDLGFLMSLTDDDFKGVALEFAGKTFKRPTE